MRLAIELLGFVFYLAAHVPVVIIYALGSSLRGVPAVPYWAAIAVGYVVLLGVAVFQPGYLGRLQRRQVLDRWLVTFYPALALSAILGWLNWPLRFAGWNAHGFGAEGWEANTLFLPWLHAGLLLLSGRFPRAKP